jgi:hypothetical protein
MSAKPGALATQLRLIAQRDVDHASLTAVHRVEAEGLARVFNFLGGGGSTQAKLRDAQHAVVVRVEGEARVILGRHPKSFHGDLFEGQQELGFVR